jgi:cytoskeleton protein RodZ
MTLEELGQAIREKREAAGMSLDDIAARIKISARILRTIEEGSLVGLPHAVYTKSFIRSFGQLVGYDPQELNAALEELFPPDAFDESKAESILRANPTMTYPDAGKRFAIILFLLALFAGLFGGTWYIAVTHGDQIVDAVKAPFSAITSPSEEKQPAAPSPTPPGGTPGAGSSLSNTVSVLTAQSSPPSEKVSPARALPPPGDLSAVPVPIATNNAPASAGVNTSSSGSATENAMPQAAPGAASSPNAGPNAGSNAGMDSLALMVDGDVPVNEEVSIPGGKNRLVIRAHAECWISSRADTRVREFMARPGTAFAITYNDRLEITFGNAGGVSLSHNGRELGAPGGDGRIVTMRFPQQ